MKKAKKTKASRSVTALDRLTVQVRTALWRETRNVILIGNLLIESRKYLEHGEWQPWLAENFDLGYHTALNYVSAAEYVARKGKSETVLHFENLSPTVLYWLAAGHYSEQEEAAILAATRERRVDQDAAAAICEALAPAEAEDADDDDDDTADDAEKAPPDPEIEAILAGPPPAVPPSAPIPPPPDFALHAFDQAISALKQLMTKPSAQFARTIHSADDLENVEDFIHAVTGAVSKPDRGGAA
jgi:Protein of unknown function (DUF3102)